MLPHTKPMVFWKPETFTPYSSTCSQIHTQSHTANSNPHHIHSQTHTYPSTRCTQITLRPSHSHHVHHIQPQNHTKKIVHTNTYTQVSHTHINKHIFVTTSASHSFHICFCNPWQRLRGICGEHVTVGIKGMGEMSCEDAGVGEMALWGDRLGEINVQRILTFERCHRGEAAGPALLWLGHVVFCRSSHSLLPFLSLSWKGGFALSVFPRVLLCLYLSQNSFLSLSRRGWLPGGWR